MFKKRSGNEKGAKKVEGRPSLGVNVHALGRVMQGGFDTVVGGLDFVTPNVVKKATKAVISDPLARVARTAHSRHTTAHNKAGSAKKATSGGNIISHGAFDLRQKIFPRRGEAGGRGVADVKNLMHDTSSQWTEKQEPVQDYILKELHKNFLFADLAPGQLNTLVQAFELVNHSKGDTIIQQGEPGDYFYILYEGGVVYDIDGEVVGSTVAAAGSEGGVDDEDHDEDESHHHDRDASPKSFGELALFFAAPRAASVIADTDCTLYRLDQVNFRLVAQHKGMQEDHRRIALLKTIPVLQDLDELSLNKLVSAMSVVTYHKDDILFHKGDHITAFFIVQSGVVQATDVSWGGAHYQDLHIGPGKAQQYFGWKAMTQDEPLIANVSAQTEATLLAIDAETFRRVVGRHDEVLKRMEYSRQLRAVAIFRDSQLEDQEVMALVDLLQTETYTRKTTLIREGTVVDASMTFVRKGSVTLESKEDKHFVPKTLDEGGYFGQEWMLVDQNKDLSDEQSPLVQSKFTVVVAPGTILDVLNLEDVRKVLNTALLGLGKPAHISGLDDTIQIGDIQRHAMLGAGSFGQVWLASYASPAGSSKESNSAKTPRTKRRVFALKVQSKHQLIETGQAEGVIAEVNIMSSLKSPFIIRLYSTFQDKQRVYMLTSLLQGGELEAVMGDSAMEDSVSQFYAAGILEGLTYMHRRHIIHRDLKPENVLIDSKGYPVLIDLGFAKYVPDKTYTFCGTPMYIAPEVVQYKGHDKGADYWSWACLVFEMVTAKYPFYESGMAELELFKKIIRGQFKIYGFMSFEAKLLFISLFVPDPDMRLGAKPNGWNDVYKMPFFAGLDFKALRKRQIEAPWVPDLKNPLDSSKFNEPDKSVEDKMASKDPPITEEQQQMFHAFGPLTDV